MIGGLGEMGTGEPLYIGARGGDGVSDDDGDGDGDGKSEGGDDIVP